MQAQKNPFKTNVSLSRGFAHGPRRCSVKVKAGFHTDAAARVKGTTPRVFKYVSDYIHLDRWMPGIQRIQTARSPGQNLSISNQFVIKQSLGGKDIDALCEVVELEKDKKVVYVVASEMHRATEQLVFMPDPNDPTFTFVRYMANIELIDWRKALQPVIAGSCKKQAEQGLRQLTALLNSRDSPLMHLEEPEERRKYAWPFGNMFQGQPWGKNGKGASSGTSATKAKQVDALGYYAALGLDPKKSRSTTAADVKIAFRGIAQTSHPDKFSMADDETQQEVEQEFKKAQRAYEVLKDPELRQLYDQGKLGAQEPSFARS